MPAFPKPNPTETDPVASPVASSAAAAASAAQATADAAASAASAAQSTANGAASTAAGAVALAATKIDQTIVDAKGDLIVATAADTVARKAVGSDGQVLTADAASAGGVKWAAAATTPSDASTSTKGVTKLSVAPVSASAPIAAGDNDPRMTDARPPSLTTWDIPVNLFGPRASDVGPWVVGKDYSSVGLFQFDSAGALNDEIGWDILLGAGTWSAYALYTKYSDSGILSVLFDGTSVGTIDGYGNALIYNNKTTITGITVATTKVVRVALKLASKNASASAYHFRLEAFGLRRTA